MEKIAKGGEVNQRYTNADLKISLFDLVLIKMMP